MRVLSQKSPKIELETKDWRIVKELISNARQPVSQIAKSCLLSRQATEYRINLLQENKLLTGSRTVVNINKLGYKSYHVFLEVHTPAQEKRVIERALASKAVNAIIVYTGQYNLEISIMAQNEEEFLCEYKKIVEEITVMRQTILTLLSTVRSEVIPKTYFPQIKDLRIEKIGAKVKKAKKEYNIDHLDLKVLLTLSRDAKISNSKLAENLNVSKDTIRYRIKNLEEQKYIVEYRPVINYATLSLSINSLLVRLSTKKGAKESFEHYLKSSGSVLWATKTFGEYDYIVYVLAKDVDEFHDSVSRMKEELEGCVQTYRVLLAFKELKYNFMAESIVEKQ